MRCSPVLARRTVLTGLLGAAAPRARGALPLVRIGLLPFGSVQWIADTIAYHRLDEAHGFSLQTATLASTEAGKVALLGGAVDVAYADWPFVAAQRFHGGHLCLAAGGSGALGGIMVRNQSPIHGLADLRGQRLGVAGGAGDKSWLLVRAAARRSGLDLAQQATLSYGAPPLLDDLIRHSRVDALLTFWNFAARLEASGFREAVSVADCARLLGLAEPLALLGWVFDDRWAAANSAAISGFVAAAGFAIRLLAGSEAEWARLRPLMDAADDRVFAALRRRFIAGIGVGGAAMQAGAERLQALLAGQDPQAGPATLPAGTFWQADAG